MLDLLNDEKEFEKFMTNVIPSAKREALTEMIRKREKGQVEDEKAREESGDNIVEMKKG